MLWQLARSVGLRIPRIRRFYDFALTANNERTGLAEALAAEVRVRHQLAERLGIAEQRCKELSGRVAAAEAHARHQIAALQASGQQQCTELTEKLGNVKRERDELSRKLGDLSGQLAAVEAGAQQERT